MDSRFKHRSLSLWLGATAWGIVVLSYVIWPIMFLVLEPSLLLSILGVPVGLREIWLKQRLAAIGLFLSVSHVAFVVWLLSLAYGTA